jgi:hypothetical protein
MESQRRSKSSAFNAFAVENGDGRRAISTTVRALSKPAAIWHYWLGCQDYSKNFRRLHSG